VRDYLVQQGVATNSVSARGFGNTLPVASNDNPPAAANRRVELLVSGDAIGSPVAQPREACSRSNNRTSCDGGRTHEDSWNHQSDILYLVLGTAGPAYAQQDQHGESKIIATSRQAGAARPKRGMPSSHSSLSKGNATATQEHAQQQQRQTSTRSRSTLSNAAAGQHSSRNMLNNSSGRIRTAARARSATATDEIGNSSNSPAQQRHDQQRAQARKPSRPVARTPQQRRVEQSTCSSIARETGNQTIAPGNNVRLPRLSIPDDRFRGYFGPEHASDL